MFGNTAFDIIRCRLRDMRHQLLDLFDFRADRRQFGAIVGHGSLRGVNSFAGQHRRLLFRSAGVVGHVLMVLSHGEVLFLHRRLNVRPPYPFHMAPADIHRFCKVGDYVL